MDEITLRNPEEWRTAHVLRFNYPYKGNSVRGSIAYLRPYTNSAVNDEVDSAIIHAIENEFGTVRSLTLDYNTFRLNGNNVDRLEPHLVGNVHLEFVVNFYPLIPFGEAANYGDRIFPSPRLNFNLSLQTNETNTGSGFHMVTAELPAEHYDEYIESIRHIETK